MAKEEEEEDHDMLILSVMTMINKYLYPTYN